MRYDAFSYLWPPRPEHAIDPTLLGSVERKGWRAQIKKNGTSSVIFVHPDKTITAMNRHNELHRQWTPTLDVMQAFADLPGQGWYVFVAELLHNKVKGIRDVNYVHDVLVCDGEYLVGRTQAERQDILDDCLMSDTAVETPSHYVINSHLWLPVEYDEGFEQLFAGLTSDADEGLVLKDPQQRLHPCMKIGSNVLGQVKVRRPMKNFSF